MTFHLHTGNRLENLADALAGLLREAPVDPFAETSVTVAHPGMARWLEIRLAETLGVVMTASAWVPSFPLFSCPVPPFGYTQHRPVLNTSILHQLGKLCCQSGRR